MDAAVILEPGIIKTPEAVDAVSLLYASRDHLGVVLGREVVGDVEHDVADYATYGGEGVRCDIF